jgi:hypothetical protein
MARDLIIADSARITPRKVFGEEITIPADHTQTGSYEIYVHDAPEGLGINKALPNSYAGRIAANAKESGMSITIGSMSFMDDR